MISSEKHPFNWYFGHRSKNKLLLFRLDLNNWRKKVNRNFEFILNTEHKKKNHIHCCESLRRKISNLHKQRQNNNEKTDREKK